MSLLSRFSIIFISLFTVAVYSNTFNAEWLSADLSFLQGKSADSSAGAVKSFPRNGGTIAGLTFALNRLLDGYDPWGYHFVNVLLHVIAALLVFWFINLLFSSPRGGEDPVAKEAAFIAFFCGTLFAVHPANTDAVTHIINRYVVLSSVFYFAAMACYLKFRLSGDRGRPFYIAALLFGFLSIHTRVAAASLPLVIWAMDSLLWGSSGKKERLLRILPFAVIAIALFFMTYTPSGTSGGFVSGALSYIYLVKYTVWPSALSVDHGQFNLGSVSSLPVAAAFFLWVILIFAALIVRRSYPVYSFALLFFLLSPVFDLFSGDPVFSDYSVYLPSFGLILAFIHYIFIFIAKRKASFNVAGAVLMTLVVIGSLAAYERNAAWADEEKIYRAAITADRQNSSALFQLGNHLIEKGTNEQGCQFVARGYALNQRNFDLMMRMGDCRIFKGDLEVAKVFYMMASQLDPNNPKVRKKLELLKLK